MLTEIGPVEIDVPRDRNGTFEPKLVRKRQRRLTGVDDLVISLVAKGLTTGEVCAHLAEIYGADVSRDTVSRITEYVCSTARSKTTGPSAMKPVASETAPSVKAIGKPTKMTAKRTPSAAMPMISFDI